MGRNEVRVALTERGTVLFTAVNRFGEHNLIELEQSAAEAFLYDLHSVVTTLRGVKIPSNRILRFFKR